MKRINILFLMLSLNVGGTERHLLNLLLHLNREKFNPVVCCLFDLGSIGKQVMNIEDKFKIYSNVINSKYDLTGIRRLLQIIRKENIHILYTINTPLTQLWGTLLAKLSGLNAFITRVTVTRPRFHGKRRRIVNRLSQSSVDRIIAQADTHKEYLIRYEGIKKEKIGVIYNGVELERFDGTHDRLGLKETLGIGGSDPVIGIVARLVPEKGHSILLKAAEKVVKEFPNACFLIVGDGAERHKLETLTRELAIESRVFFLGTRKDIPKILSIFDVAVLSSVDETLSNAVLEYMAAAKPVVATNAGSTSDLVDDGETGFIVSRGDYEALADALLKLLKNGDLAENMGKRGRERIKDKFTIPKMIDEYESLFLNLLKEN